MIPSLVQFGLLALGLAAALALFLSLKRELRSQSRKNRARMDEILQQLQSAQKPGPAPESGPAESAPAPQFRSGINVNKRVQALRLLRRGEDISHVAAALGIPRREIELLMRVQNLSAKRAAGASG